jgi:uncharacterized repeat protein (TIGR01451 family)
MRSRASRISGDAELVITKTVSPKVAAVGDVLTYTVTVTNRGPDAAVQVVNTDASRGKNPILSLKPSQGSCTLEPSLRCSFGDIASGATVTVIARVLARQPGVVTDTAAVTASGPDPATGDHHSTAVVRILAAPLRITKRASPGDVQSGSIASFAIRVTNQSGAAVHNVSVCDRLPAGWCMSRAGPCTERRPAGTSVRSQRDTAVASWHESGPSRLTRWP